MLFVLHGHLTQLKTDITIFPDFSYLSVSYIRICPGGEIARKSKQSPPSCVETGRTLFSPLFPFTRSGFSTSAEAFSYRCTFFHLSRPVAVEEGLRYPRLKHHRPSFLNVNVQRYSPVDGILMGPCNICHPNMRMDNGHHPLTLVENSHFPIEHGHWRLQNFTHGPRSLYLNTKMDTSMTQYTHKQRLLSKNAHRHGHYWLPPTHPWTFLPYK